MNSLARPDDMMNMHGVIRGTRNGSLTADDFRPSAREHRREDRIETFKPVRVFNRLNQERLGYLSDCSPHGVSVLLRTPMEVGDEFVLKIYLDRPRLAVYNVRHSDPQGDGWHKIGGVLADLIGVRNSQEFEAVFRTMIEAAEL